MSAVTAALQRYADRGVFRGFRATPAPRRRTAYEFKWLTKTPLHAVFDAASNTLRFDGLLPHIGAAAAADVAGVVSARTQRGVPGHKRVDGRRARLSGAVRRGAFSLAVTVRGDNHDYAVSTALNVINEMFVTLQERHPDYLIQHFGISPE